MTNNKFILTGDLTAASMLKLSSSFGRGIFFYIILLWGAHTHQIPVNEFVPEVEM